MNGYVSAVRPFTNKLEFSNGGVSRGNAFAVYKKEFVRPNDQDIPEVGDEEIESKDPEGMADSSEAQEPYVPPCGVRPSIVEVDKHNATHIPFRSWCPYCVAGKAKNNLHWKRKEKISGVNMVQID